MLRRLSCFQKRRCNLTKPMNVESVQQYCLSLKAVTEDMPFGEDTLVFRIGGKIFGLMSLNENECRVNLKCTPDYAIELREKYEDIIPGYHMSKKHWNTVYCERCLEDKIIRELIQHSYQLVFESLSKAVRDAI